MKPKHVCWNDLDVGTKIPELPKTPNSQTLVKWAAASGDFNPLHYEYQYAQSQGFEKPILQGQLKRAWLIQMITDWLGNRCFLRKLSCEFRQADYPVLMKSMVEAIDKKPTHWCKGLVIDKGIKEDNHFIVCDIWVENKEGIKITVGKAEIILPPK